MNSGIFPSPLFTLKHVATIRLNCLEIALSLKTQYTHSAQKSPLSQWVCK